MSFFGGNTSLGATSTPAKPGGMFSSFNAGAQTTAAPTFGATAAPAPLPALGGFGNFGAPAASSAPSLFATAAAAPTVSAAPAFGGFGLSAPSSAPATSGFQGFGSTAPTTSAAPGFGGFGATPAFNPGGFGAGGFGSAFAKPATGTTVTPGFGGFGGTTNFMLGQQQQPAPQISPEEAFAQSILNVAIFGDERDNIIAKWNYLQAMWGTGKLFYSQSAAPVDATQQNNLCRFKAMGYSRMPGKDNKLGLVALNFNKPIADVTAQQQQIVQSLHNIFGSKPNVMVLVDSCKEVENKRCQLVIYIEEKSQVAPNESKRILATDVANFLSQPNVKQQLNNLGIFETLPLVLPDEDQLKEYLENPPKGVDPRMWRQANLDNPDAKTFIPVPMIGFNDLKWRVKCQEQEIEKHALYLKKLDKDLIELRQRHAASSAKIMEQKRKLAELSHRILKVIVKQECTRKVGLALSPEEEALRSKLENMQAVLSAPTQFKGRLSELLSQMRMQRNQFALNSGNDYTIDKDSEKEMQIFLSMQQKAMEALTETVTKDMKCLDIILKELPELRQT